MAQYNLYNMEPLLWKKSIKIISPSYRQTQHAIMAHGEPAAGLHDRPEVVSWSTRPGK